MWCEGMEEVEAGRGACVEGSGPWVGRSVPGHTRRSLRLQEASG